ncbi:uncharacterized protein LOC130563164 isoform X2 [Triplophysa rosa]|nr:uncharacterized protein LOC130563164 isoform X2 [Triplophysa rosa]
MTTKVRTLPSTKLSASTASVVRPWKDEVTSESELYRFYKGFTYEVISPNVPLDTTPCDVPVIQRERKKREKEETQEVKKTAKVSTPPSTEGQGVRTVDPCILKVVREPEEPLETMNIFTITELKAYERRQQMLKKERKEQETQRRIELGEQVDKPSLKKRLIKKCSKLLNKTVLQLSCSSVVRAWR